MSSPKQLVRIGIFYLEEAILDVLFEAMEADREAPYIKLRDIKKQIGGEWKKHGWSARELLKKLEEKPSRVEQREAGGPWKLTETEYQKRR